VILSDESWGASARTTRCTTAAGWCAGTETPEGGVTWSCRACCRLGSPGFIERFLPQDGRVTQTDDWGPASGGSRSGTWKVEIPGAPAKLGGTMRPGAHAHRQPVRRRRHGRGEGPARRRQGRGLHRGMVTKLAAKEAEVLRSALTAGEPA
jgi:hypothetical protein